MIYMYGREPARAIHRAWNAPSIVTGPMCDCDLDRIRLAWLARMRRKLRGRG